LKNHLLVDTARCPVLEAVAHHQARDAAGGLHVLDGPLGLAARVVEGLSHLGRDQTGQLLLVLVQEGAQLEEVARALLGRRGPPLRKGFLSSLHGALDVGRRP
jgi:hypothetical protein